MLLSQQIRLNRAYRHFNINSIREVELAMDDAAIARQAGELILQWHLLPRSKYSVQLWPSLPIMKFVPVFSFFPWKLKATHFTQGHFETTD